MCVSEHQELVRQVDAAQHREQRQDLQRELERLVARMEEKGAQITKLRKHQQSVCEPALSTTQRLRNLSASSACFEVSADDHP